MLIVGAKGNKILNCSDVFIKNRVDYTDRNSVFCYDVKGTLINGRTETIKSFNTEDEARQFIFLLTRDFGANTRALEGNDNDGLERTESIIR